MNARTASADAADVRGHILDAAEQHFRLFGFRKSTMAEIARDVGMSAANLYRYFENKEDLGAACCERAMQQRVDRLRAVVRNDALSAVEKLESFILENLKYSHEIVEKQPKISEMVESLTTRNPALVRQKVAAIESLLAEILAFGNARGDFDVEDVVTSASTLHSALVLFEVPIFVGLYPREDYERRAVALARLLVDGLAAK